MADVEELIAEGMRRQLEAFRAAIAGGMTRVGWKLGITDPVARERLGIPAPIVGWLDGRRVVPDGGSYTLPPHGSTLLEAELAVSLARDVPPSASAAEAAAAIGAVAPAFEFVDPSKPRSPLDEMLAHDILHEAVLFGAQAAPGQAAGFNGLGLPRISVNGELRAVGAPGRVPDELGEMVLLVAKTLAPYGESLRHDDRIICGTYIDPFPLSRGDAIEGDFGPLGRLVVRVGG